MVRVRRTALRKQHKREYGGYWGFYKYLRRSLLESLVFYGTRSLCEQTCPVICNNNVLCLD
jgi:hypothetical protein